jgi:hypothetical protein
MTPEFTALFLVVALALFLLAAFNVPVPRVNLVALGLACWVFVSVWSAVGAL